MPRYKRTPEERARRAKIAEFARELGIGSYEDGKDFFKEMIAVLLEGGLEAELDDELGYTKYDYRNKATTNSRNGHSKKTLRSSHGDIDISVPRDREGEFEPQLIKKNQTSLSGDIEEKILSMYERGVVTYPRSDCAYLPTSIHADAPKIFESIKRIAPKCVVDGADLSRTSAAFDDSKVAEHYAIVPTGKAEELSGIELKIYELIAQRFALQFYPPHEYLETKGEISFADETFAITGRETTSAGWRDVYSPKGDKPDDEDDESGAKIPTLNVGDAISPIRLEMRSKKTSPPKPFTDATLLKAMNGIHNYVSDPEIKKVLKENDGLGTAATQAAIIERIIKVGYVAHEGKKIVSTDKGRTLISNLPEALTTPDRTALWEMEMKKIAEGGMALDDFLGDVFGEIQKLTAEINASQTFAFKSEGRGGDPKFPCFVCKTPMRRIARKDGSGHFWKCTNDECGKIFDDAKGKPVKPVVCPKCGKELSKRTRKSDGKPFWSCSCGLFLDDDGGKPMTTRKCPKCGGIQKQLVAKSGSKYWKCADDKCGEVSFDDAKQSYKKSTKRS